MQTFTLKKIISSGLLLTVALSLSGCGGSGSGTLSSSSSSQRSGSSGGTSQESGSSGGNNSSSPPSQIPPQGNGSLSVSWTAPVTRADGTPMSLADIDGYRIYYGRGRGNYTNQVNITNGAATSKTVSNLASGKYYLVMTTYDNSGRESARSPEISKQAM